MTIETIAALTKSQVHHATRATALRLAQTLEVEYPRLALKPLFDTDTPDAESRVTGWLVIGNFEEVVEILRTVRVPHLADVLADCTDLGYDPEEPINEAEEEAEKASGNNIVKEKYRQRYAEVSSTGQSCGDWLAEWLALQTMQGDKFQPDAFKMILDANDIDQSGAWGRLLESGQKGAVGRWRMNGRQILEKQVALVGYVKGPLSDPVFPPAEAVEILRARHAKWIAKEEKRILAAKQAIVEAENEQTPGFEE